MQTTTKMSTTETKTCRKSEKYRHYKDHSDRAGKRKLLERQTVQATHKQTGDAFQFSSAVTIVLKDSMQTKKLKES